MPGRWSASARRSHPKQPVPVVVLGCLTALVLAGCGADGPVVDEADGPVATAPQTEPPPTTPPPQTPTPDPAPTTSPAEPSPTGQADGSPPAPPATPTKDTGMTTSPDPAPDVITEADDGRAISLAVGDEVPLQLDSAWFWDQPSVDGDAVELVQVDYFTDPGFMEWIVTAVRPGDAVVSATGEPNCDDESRCPPTAVRLAFHVD